MGSGSFSPTSYNSTMDSLRSSGKSTFDYGDSMRSSTPRAGWKVHEDLDPLRKNTSASELHPDMNVRECLDSEEHPTTVPIAVLFDVTGSMGQVPRKLVEKLPELYGLLLRKGYAEHPSILFGGIGDATCDRVPLQVGQFESDNRAHEDLMKVVLEGGGGGQQTESYELAMMFMARHTYTDAYEQRGQRGYLFIIGDEEPYEKIGTAYARDLMGDELMQPLSTADVAAELLTKWDTYLIRPSNAAGASYARGTVAGDHIFSHWSDLLGQQILEVDDLDHVVETIATMIGLGEGAIDSLDEGVDNLHEFGLGDAAATVSKALAHRTGAGSLATFDGPAVDTDDDPDLATT